jgi:hypothetical protein
MRKLGAWCATVTLGAVALHSTSILAAGTLPHFRCYAVEGPAPGQVVNLNDQFNVVQGPVREPKYLCTEVDKEVIKGLTLPTKGALDHLVCYVLTGPPATKDAVIDNQLQGQFVRVGAGELLCVPTTKTPVPKPTREQIVEHMSTNICRCGTYQRIVRAVERAAREA